VLRDHDDGVAVAPQHLTVAHVVADWLMYGLNGRSKNTVAKCTHLCMAHIVPALGALKLRELTAPDGGAESVDLGARGPGRQARR
jgi:hypothetical protein